MAQVGASGEWTDAEEEKLKAAWVEETPEIGKYLTFREHLRQNDADRSLYEDSKRRLAARKWTYIQQYADAKDEVVQQIMRRAKSA